MIIIYVSWIDKIISLHIINKFYSIIKIFQLIIIHFHILSLSNILIDIILFLINQYELHSILDKNEVNI